MLEAQKEEYVYLAQLDPAKIDDIPKMSIGNYVRLLLTLHKRKQKTNGN